MNWFKIVLVDNYANFSGRARRQEYWMYVLFWLLIVTAIVLLDSLTDELFGFTWSAAAIILLILATLIPWLAVNVRRLHDIGKSGGYIFINFVPIIGRIWYLILVCTAGDNGKNRYGKDPKQPDIDDEIDDIGKPLLEE